MRANGHTLGVVVAGGRGERLGLSVPKALARLGGLTLLERALATLEAACDHVVVAAPAELVLPVERARRADDPAGSAGPLAGLVAGLEARAWTRALALGVDFPCMGARVLERLLDALGDAAAVVPAPGGVLQPLVAAYGPAAAAPLRQALDRGERSVTRAVAALPLRVVSGSELAHWEGGVGAFLNVNTPTDLAEAVRCLDAHAEPGR